MKATAGRRWLAGLLGLTLALGGCASTPPEKIKVGILLPDGGAGPRWDNADQPALENQFKGNDYAFEPDTENVSAPDEAAATTTKMINDGCKVLVFAAANRDIETAITKTAAARAIPTVGYDLTGTGTSAQFAIAPDYRKIGELTGRGLVRGVRDKEGATVIELLAAPTTGAATQLAEGERDILAPRYDKHIYRLVASERVNAADSRAVGATLTRLLDTHGGKVDAVLTANDAVAVAAIAVLRQRGLAGKVTVTGYGASTEALKAILRGEQFMTAYTPPAVQAEAAAELAKALARGDQARVDQLAPPAPGGQPRTIHVPPAAVALDNINQVFNSGIVESSDVCDNTLALRCNQLSIP